MEFSTQFIPFAEKMRQEGLPEVAIRTFYHYYQQLIAGQTGLITEANIDPVIDLPDAEAFPSYLPRIGQNALEKTILLKLNGGLGTSMGLAQAKSLLPVKDGLSFLDIITRQAYQANIPLVLMNSFNTRDDSLKALNTHSTFKKSTIPLDFLQHKVPKVAQADFSPVQWPENPTLEWCPPGHGDIYTALITSDMLDTLLAEGREYAFVSNADNLGAVIDLAILGYFVEQNAPFMMEVADRTAADKKGGHLARRSRQLILRESAQCPENEMTAFQDIARYRYFNTNNLWLNLAALKEKMIEQNNVLDLPMIRNAKPVDPKDISSPLVYQLETAMGAAISIFAEAQAIRVPRTRFAPVKTTNDLLAVRSDAYIITSDDHIIVNPQRTLGPIEVNLDPTYYKLISDMEERFPEGVPSLLNCQRLTIKGDIRFNNSVTLRGDVLLINASSKQITIETGTVIEGERRW